MREENPFTVHVVPGSPFSRSVCATLVEKGLPFRVSAVPPAALRGTEHLRRHPFGRVPVLDHGDFRLWETQAILRYLDRIAPEPPLTPADPRAMARMDRAMNVCDWYVFRDAGVPIAFQRIVVPQVLGGVPDEAAIAAAMPAAIATFAVLDDLLGDAVCFAGPAVSLADLMLAPQVDMLAGTPEWRDLAAAAPRVAAWLDRMAGRPALRETTWERIEARAGAPTEAA